MSLFAQICLRYLLMEDLEDDEGKSCSNIRNLLEYSAVHWADHVRRMTLTSDQEVTDRLHRVYNMSGKRFSLWFPIFWEATPSNLFIEASKVFPGRDQLIVSVGTGLAKIMKWQPCLTTVATDLAGLATETERTADDFQIPWKFSLLHISAQWGLSTVARYVYHRAEEISFFDICNEVNSNGVMPLELAAS